MGGLRLKIGCKFHFVPPAPVAAVFQVRPRPDGAHQLIEEAWLAAPAGGPRSYLDVHGNLCDRFTLPAGPVTVHYRALAAVSVDPDPVDESAGQHDVADLPPACLVYTLPSRYCLSDQLADIAWDLFGGVSPGWARVQAISDWVHEHIAFGYGSSTPLTTAADVYESRQGVCRDFAHLAVTFCRALNIPTRYVFGYLPDIGVPPPENPMDFCAWMEAFIGGQWHTFDPRNNQRRVGRVVIGRGRDALDVAMVTSWGAAPLEDMVVWAEEAT